MGFFPWTFENYYFPGESKLDVNLGLKSTPPHRDCCGLYSCHNRTFRLQWICPSKKMQHPHSSFFSSQRLPFWASMHPAPLRQPRSSWEEACRKGEPGSYLQVFGTKSDPLKA